MKKSQSPNALQLAGSLTSKNGKPVALGEEEQAEAKELMNNVLQRSGSIGGSRTLFVDSKSALF